MRASVNDIPKKLAWIGFVLSVLLSAGCNGSGIPTAPNADSRAAPVQPKSDPGERNHPHFILTAGTLSFNRDTRRPEYIPARIAAAHWNVTSLLQPPHCHTCVELHLQYFDLDGGQLGIDVTLRNPTTLTAYDVRAILLPADDNPDTGVTLLNCDSYTRLWDDGGDVVTNPFMAYGKQNDHRAFPGGGKETILFRISFSDPGDLVSMPFVVDACWPSNCEEPFEITALQEGSLFTDGSGSLDLSVFVKSWNTSYDNVFIDLTPIGGPNALPLTLDVDWVEPNCQLYTGRITSPSGIDEGLYTLWIRAHTPESQVALWTRILVRVFPAGHITSGESAAIFSIYFSYMQPVAPEFTGRYLYAGAEHGFNMYDVADPTNPTIYQSISIGWNATVLQILTRDDLIFVLTLRQGVKIYHEDDLGRADAFQTIDPDPSDDDYDYRRICLFNDMLYLFISDWYDTRMQVYNVDISDINNPVVCGPFEFQKPDDYPIEPDPTVGCHGGYFYELLEFQATTETPYDRHMLLIWRLGEGDNAPELVNEMCVCGDPGTQKIDRQELLFHEDYLLITIETDTTGDWKPGVPDYCGFLVYYNGNPEVPAFIKYDEDWSAKEVDAIYRVGRDSYVYHATAWSCIIDLSQLPDIKNLGTFELDGFEIAPTIESCDPDRGLAYFWFGLWPNGREGPYVLDTSNPMDTRIIGKGEGVGGDGSTALFDVEIQEPGIAYCAWGYPGVVILDVTDPNHPTKPVFMDTPGLARDLWQRDGIVYIADRDTGLVVADCTDPAHPSIVKTIPVGAESSRIDGKGNYLFVGRELKDIVIFDISLPLSPVQIGELSDPEEDILYFVVDGNRLLYRTDYYIGEFDISNLSNVPPPLRANAGWLYDLLGLAARDGLVLSEYEGNLSVWDLNEQSITDEPAAITDYFTGSYDVRPPYGFSYACFSPGYSALLILDLTTPSDPQVVDVVGELVGDGAYSPKAFGNYVFLPSLHDGLEVVRLW